MKVTHLSWPPPNVNWIGEVCDSLGTTSLTSGEGRNYQRFFDQPHWVEMQGVAGCAYNLAVQLFELNLPINTDWNMIFTYIDTLMQHDLISLI